MFGESEFKPDQAYSSVPLEEQYDALAEARTAGKILEFGVSNETPWGLMRLCELCEFPLAHQDWSICNCLGSCLRAGLEPWVKFTSTQQFLQCCLLDLLFVCLPAMLFSFKKNSLAHLPYCLPLWLSKMIRRIF